MEWNLKGRDSLKPTSIFRLVVHDRPDYLISTLAQIGDGDLVELLRTYVDDPTLGSSAIWTIKQLTGQKQ